MFATQLTPSSAIAEIAASPGILSATDLQQGYNLSASQIGKHISPLTTRDWVRSVVSHTPAMGRPRQLLYPTEQFWCDFQDISQSSVAALTSNEQDVHAEAVTAGVTMYELVNLPDSAEYMKARVTMLGSAVLLSERHSLEQHGWFGDKQSWLGLLLIQSLIKRHTIA